MIPYDSKYEPPAPIAKAKLWNPGNHAERKDVSLAVDTGADVSLLPAGVVRELGITAIAGKIFRLTGFDGGRFEAVAADLGMEWLDAKIRGRFLLIERDVGIPGRDVLNHFKLILDGPNLEWSRGG